MPRKPKRYTGKDGVITVEVGPSTSITMPRGGIAFGNPLVIERLPALIYNHETGRMRQVDDDD